MKRIALIVLMACATSGVAADAPIAFIGADVIPMDRERVLTDQTVIVQDDRIIATVLGCSPSTINNHRNTIRKKLGLSGESANLQAFLNDNARSPIS